VIPLERNVPGKCKSTSTLNLYKHVTLSLSTQNHRNTFLFQHQFQYFLLRSFEGFPSLTGKTSFKNVTFHPIWHSAHALWLMYPRAHWPSFTPVFSSCPNDRGADCTSSDDKLLGLGLSREPPHMYTASPLEVVRPGMD
jgi:hypothetical protein